VLHLTSSAFALGVTAGLQFGPTLLLGLVGGVIADRVDKRKLVVVTQSAMACLALILGSLALSGFVQVWMIWCLALALGIVTALDTPTRQSFVAEMVGPDQLGNAVSLNSAVFNGARVVGPAFAGILIALVGTPICFLVNAASYLAVVGCLLAMRPAELSRGEPLHRARGQLVEALHYAWSSPSLRVPLLLMSVVGTLGFNFTVILPLMAKYAFRGGPGTFGAMFSAMGLGALAGALASASRNRPTQRLLVGSALAFGILLIGAALAPNLAVELALLPAVGFAAIIFQASDNSLLQLNSDRRFRGRVMAMYVVLFMGSSAIGGPTMGWIAEHFGARAAPALAGAATVLAAAVTSLGLLRRRTRR